MFGMMGLGLLEAEIIGAEVGMMMGAGRMMGRGMGMCAPGCMNSCCRRVIICPPGCMGPCCATRVMCAPGCNLPCCMGQRQIVTRNYYAPPPRGVINTDPYSPNSFFGTSQPQQMNSYQQMTPFQPMKQQQANYDMQNDMQRQKLLQRQATMNEEKRNQQQMAQKLRIERQQLILKQQEQKLNQQRFQQEVELKRIAEQKAALMMNQQKIQQQKREILPEERNLEVGLFQGNVYQKMGSEWKSINAATLTLQSFINVPILQMIKIKIKGQSEINLTRLIKISTYSGDTFFSVFENQQIELGTKIIWAKLTTMGKQSRLDEPFNGHIEGPIVKKTFFSGWQAKYANISGDAFRISNQVGTPPQRVINRIPELWTRFEFVRNNLLVLKMHHNGSKVQIGVPIQNAVAWIRALCNLIPTF